MKLKEQAVLQKSVWLIPGCSGEGAGVLDSVEDKLQGAPQCVAWKYETATTGGLFGKRNPLTLVVSDDLLPEHRVCITTHSWGGNLCCAWLLLAAPNLVQSLLRFTETHDSKARYRVDDILAPLDQVEVFCLSTSTFNATKAAIDDLTREKEIDANKTTGFDDLANAT